MKPALSVHNIGPDLPFAATLAEWICAHYDSADRARLRVLLPNRRACRTLREALLRLSGGQPMLLPRIHPIGDWETDDLPPDLLSAEALQTVAPAITENRRLMLLTQLVMEFEARRERESQCAQALQLARQLAYFLDEITRNGVDIFTLPKLAEGAELAEHWQQTVDFLSILSQQWPRVLQEEGAIDPVARRNTLLKTIAHQWAHTPPGYPVIAAGSTGTQPATAALLAAIAKMPQGKVIVPGLDQSMPDDIWKMLEPTHPQYALKTLLAHIGIERSVVTSLISKPGNENRQQTLQTVFQPAAATAAWQSITLPKNDALHGIKLYEAESPSEEARVVAVALRETLETPGKTAALVTPDRELARRVAAMMQRFGITVDDSGGTPLLDTPPGVYMRLIAEYLLSDAAPIQLLSLLRHPLTAVGVATAECRSLSQLLDITYLRGVRNYADLTTLRQKSKLEHPALSALLSRLQTEGKTFFVWLNGRKKLSARDLFVEHIRLAEALAATEENSGEQRLWAGDDGNQLATVLAEIAPTLETLPPIDPHTYPAFFTALLGDKIYRPRYGKHLRLSILSPIEARLQHFDRVILGGLNEDSWPPRPAADPWMSRPMRTAFGLPPLERDVGQSAHDIIQLITASPEVLLTRAKKSKGKPTVASRWLVRMKTLLAARNEIAWQDVCETSHYTQAIAMMDVPANITPITRPAPKPPLAARPKRLRATMVETWQRDLYSIYAAAVLDLKKLNELDEEPSAKEFGTLVHAALKLFSDRYPNSSLLECGREVFNSLLARPAVAALWWPRFETLAAWFTAEDKKRREQGRNILTEREASWPMEVDGKSFTFTTRIDRLEMDDNGNATLVDYKTGSLPTDTDIKKGIAAQLPVEGLIVTNGISNPPLPQKITVADLEYWRLAGNADNCEIKPLQFKDTTVETLLKQCHELLNDIVLACADPEFAFAAESNTKQPLRYNDYEHLTRRKEWGEA